MLPTLEDEATVLVNRSRESVQLTLKRYLGATGSHRHMYINHVF